MKFIDGLLAKYTATLDRFMPLKNPNQIKFENFILLGHNYSGSRFRILNFHTILQA